MVHVTAKCNSKVRSTQHWYVLMY